MGTSSEAGDEKSTKFGHERLAVSTREVDTAAELLYGEQGPLDPVEALRVRSVVVWVLQGSS